MVSQRIGTVLVFCHLAVFLALPANAAEKGKTGNVKPYPHYWMSVATSNQSIPGMSGEMPGFGALFGGKGPGFGPRRELLLQLESPLPAPAKPEAQHVIPPGQKMGDALPLLTPPRPERGEYTPMERGTPEKYEKPKARMLIYWGCGEAVAKGQPRVIDTSKMNPSDFGKAFSGRTPTRQPPPSPHSSWVYGEWPNQENRTDVPRDSSLAGNHLVKGNYLPDINFALDSKRDFMAAVEFTNLEQRPNSAFKVDWKAVPTAIGYFATAMAHNEQSGETIFWSASQVPETGFALMDYLTPGDVSRFIKEKVVMEPSRTTCTIPPVFKDTPGAMLQFIAYGEELNLIHPPKPKDPKKAWDPLWSVKVRLKSTGMTMLSAGPSDGEKKSRKPDRSNSTEETPSSADRKNPDDAVKDGVEKGVKDKLKGFFGF